MVRRQLMKQSKNILNYLIIIGLIPIIILIGVTVFSDRSYLFIATAVAILAIVSVFLTFEKNETNTRRLVFLSVLIAISVVGILIFFVLCGFRPVTAIVVIYAMFLGSEAVFLVDSLSALISNIYLGQGPWTPFQMFARGMLGFIAGFPYISA